MAVVAKFLKDKDAVLDYQLDWTAYLADGDTIDTAEWAVVGTDPDLTVDLDIATATATTVWLSGGIATESPYVVTCHIETVQGRADDRSIQIKIGER